MGTSKSRPSSKGQIFIQTQKGMYYVNETIHGQVCLNVQQAGFPAGIVQLRFVGKDFAKRVESRGSGKNRHTVRMIINSKFVNCPIQLQDYGKELPVTQVIFPFHVALNLSTMTFKYYFCPNNWAYIKFYLIAQVINNPKKKLDEVIKFKLPLTIVKPYVPMIRPVKLNRRQNVVYCCCCKNGYSIYDYDVPKTDLKFGETFNMTLNVDLFNCEKELLFIKMYIWGKCLVSHYEKTEYQMTYHYQQLEGCAKGQKKSYTITQTLNKEKSGGDFELQSTSVSPKINYNYYVSFYYNYKGCTCCFKSEDDILITIIRPPKKAQIEKLNNPEFKPPVSEAQLKEWKPSISKETTLVVNQQQVDSQVPIQQQQINQIQKVHPEENYNNYHAYNNNYQPVPQTYESQIMPQSKQENQPIQNHKIQDNPFG